MRLRVGRGWGLLFIPMVKLASGGCGMVGAWVSIGGGCCMSWKCLRRLPNVRSARSGRAGLSLRRRCRMVVSCSAVRVGSITLIFSICGRRGTWSK